MKRRVESWTVTREVWVLRRGAAEGARAATAWCAACAGPSGMLTIEEAAGLAGVSKRTVYHWVESGRVHYAEEPGGQLFVCLVSLPKAVE